MPMSCVRLSLLLLPLLLPLSAVKALSLRVDDVTLPCRLASIQPSAAVCSPNASRIDLSARGLTGRLVLTFSRGGSSDGSSGSSQQLRLDSLDLSDNPGLTSVVIVADDVALRAVQIGRLDISGTAVAPLPGHFLSFPAGLLSVRSLRANGTAWPAARPLDLGRAAELLYRLRVQTFALIGWPVAASGGGGDWLPADLTSHGANSCASKRFESLTVSRLRGPARVLTGGAARRPPPVMAVSDAIDLSSNDLREVSNVTFSAGRVDLSDNRLADLPGVAFLPGSVCRAAVTGPPTLLLRRNRLARAAIDQLAAGSPIGFSGLDLSGNERLLEEEAAAAARPAANATPPTIAVTDFLGLSGLAGRVDGLAALLARFRYHRRRTPASTARAATAKAAATATFRLALADNWIPDLASAASLVADFVASANGSAPPPLVHLDLSGNPLLVHLNLSDMPPHLLASLTARRLPHLRSASVRVANGAGVLERLRRRGERPDGTLLATLWSRRVSLRLDASADRCCLADDLELVCSFGGGQQQQRQPPNRRARYGSVFCFDDSGSSDSGSAGSWMQPELPLLFTCVVLGCALLLGLATGVAVFYARHSRGRYAVYSIYAVYSKDQQQQQQQQRRHHQLHSQVQRPHSGMVQLKAVSTVVPVEKAATPV